MYYVYVFRFSGESMDGSGKIDVLKEHEPVGEEIEGEAEEQIEEEEQSSDDYYSYNSTDSSIDLGEYNYLLQERSETLIKTPAVTFESDEEEKDEALKRSKSGTLEILSEQTELSDESAWEREGSKRKHRLTLVENLTEDSLEVIRETQVDLEEATSEQMFGETEEMEEEQLEEEEEEELEPEEVSFLN